MYGHEEIVEFFLESLGSFQVVVTTRCSCSIEQSKTQMDFAPIINELRGQGQCRLCTGLAAIQYDKTQVEFAPVIDGIPVAHTRLDHALVLAAI